MSVNRILTIFSVLLPVVFAISMVAFVFSFAACVKDAGIVDKTISSASHESGTTSHAFFKDEVIQDTVQYEKAELIVFNSEGDVVYNKIIPDIKSAL